jgi:hypothetical protein
VLVQLQIQLLPGLPELQTSAAFRCPLLALPGSVRGIHDFGEGLNLNVAHEHILGNGMEALAGRWHADVAVAPAGESVGGGRWYVEKGSLVRATSSSLCPKVDESTWCIPYVLDPPHEVRSVQWFCLLHLSWFFDFLLS